MLKGSSLFLLVVWFFVCGVAVLKNASLNGFWIPTPDFGNPVTLLLCLFFYGPPLLVMARGILERHGCEGVTVSSKTLAISVTASATMLSLYALFLVAFAVAMI